MLDLGYFRAHLDEIEAMARNRRATLDLAKFREIDAERRQLITANEKRKADRNQSSEEIANLKRAGGDASEILARMKRLAEEIQQDDARVAVLDEALREFMLTFRICRTRACRSARARRTTSRCALGRATEIRFRAAAALGSRRGRGDSRFPAAVKMSGTRLHCIRGLGARLERAIANFFLDVHTREHGYTEILPPFHREHGIR